MIRRLKFNNFYSFKEEQEISFIANKKKSYDYFSSPTGDQITKIAGFIGGNASGKTNIMRLFSFIRYFVCETSKKDSEAKQHIATKSFFNNLELSNFYVEFEITDMLYSYEFSVQDNSILSESLSLKQIKQNAKWVNVYKRKNNSIEKLSTRFIKGLPTSFISNIRSDISLIAFIKANYSVSIIDTVFDYFSRMRTNINEVGDINNSRHKQNTLRMYLQDVDLKKLMEDFVCKFDLGLLSFEIKRLEDENKSDIAVRGLHHTAEPNQFLDFIYESRGTQSLFFTLANILSALRNNSTAIIDEIELGLHPEALNKLIRYFIDENSSGSAQIIFSSHSLGFMSILDMHQIYLVEKNDNGESHSYRLNQVENIRSDENYLAKYMTGSYGAYPKIKT